MVRLLSVLFFYAGCFWRRDGLLSSVSMGIVGGLVKLALLFLAVFLFFFIFFHCSLLRLLQVHRFRSDVWCLGVAHFCPCYDFVCLVSAVSLLLRPTLPRLSVYDGICMYNAVEMLGYVSGQKSLSYRLQLQPPLLPRDYAPAGAIIGLSALAIYLLGRGRLGRQIKSDKPNDHR
jgi:hypothetical protein